MLDRIFTSTLSAGILQAAQRATCRKKGCRNCQTRGQLSFSRFPSRGSRQTDVDFSQRSSTNRLTKSRLQESDRQSKVRSEALPAKLHVRARHGTPSFFFGGRFFDREGCRSFLPPESFVQSSQSPEIQNQESFPRTDDADFNQPKFQLRKISAG